MKKSRLIIITVLLSLTASLFAQEDKKFGIEWSGFVKNDVFYDTRQVIAAREGHFLLFPTAPSLDANTVQLDKNDAPGLNMLSIQTRLKGAISGPDAFGAKTSGLIEGAFFGHSDADVNGFRLRHAFTKLNWEKTELLFGQTWHPLFVTACFPNTVSFNTGVPFQPFSRNPQVRLTKKLGTKISFAATALSQRDFASTGPVGTSSIYARNAAMPEFQGHFQFNMRNAETNTGAIFGFGGGYKTLRPQLFTANNFVEKSTVASLSGLAFCNLKLKTINIKVEGVYGENMTDMLMIGGYAVSAIDAITAEQTYTPFTNGTVWTDIETNGKKLQAGIFAGYTKNMGTKENIIGATYARSANIDYVYRVSPRIVFNSGKTRLATEFEYTTAAYGTTQLDGSVLNAKEVSNLRVNFSVFYFF